MESEGDQSCKLPIPEETQNQQYSFKKLFIQIGKIISASENSEKQAKWAVFPQNALFINFSFEYRTFLINSKNIHSENLFIQ